MKTLYFLVKVIPSAETRWRGGLSEANLAAAIRGDAEREAAHATMGPKPAVECTLQQPLCPETNVPIYVGQYSNDQAHRSAPTAGGERKAKHE
jgi:hypothetical protein